MSRFIAAVKQIIQEKPIKDFKSFRNEVLPVVKEFRLEKGKEFKENMFSNHAWTDILQKHPELKKIWDSRASFKTPQESDLEITEILNHEEELKFDFIQRNENFMQDSPSTNLTVDFSPYNEVNRMNSYGFLSTENNDQQNQTQRDKLDWNLEQHQDNVETFFFNHSPRLFVKLGFTQDSSPNLLEDLSLYKFPK